jgi:DNA ligase 3
MLSIFLMSCLNEKSKKWCTVTKVHGGLDDDELNKLQVHYLLN